MKKAQTDLVTASLIGIILLLIVVSLMLVRAYKESISTKYDKMFLSQDLGMFIDVEYASPNNLVVRYPQKTYDYSFKFEESRVIVYKEIESFILGEEFPFTEESDIKFHYKTLSPFRLSGKFNFGDEDTIQNTPIIFIKTNAQMEPFSGVFVQDVK